MFSIFLISSLFIYSDDVKEPPSLSSYNADPFFIYFSGKLSSHLTNPASPGTSTMLASPPRSKSTLGSETSATSTPPTRGRSLMRGLRVRRTVPWTYRSHREKEIRGAYLNPEKWKNSKANEKNQILSSGKIT